MNKIRSKFLVGLQPDEPRLVSILPGQIFETKYLRVSSVDKLVLFEIWIDEFWCEYVQQGAAKNNPVFL